MSPAGYLLIEVYYSHTLNEWYKKEHAWPYNVTKSAKGEHCSSLVLMQDFQNLYT
jgi:hypothetical protein